MTIKHDNFDILSISETWLNDSILDSEIILPGYNSTRYDRENGKRGGGVLIYVWDNLPYKLREDFAMQNNSESCWIEILKPKRKKMKECFFAVFTKPTGANNVLLSMQLKIGITYL